MAGNEVTIGEIKDKKPIEYAIFVGGSWCLDLPKSAGAIINMSREARRAQGEAEAAAAYIDIICPMCEVRVAALFVTEGPLDDGTVLFCPGCDFEILVEMDMNETEYGDEAQEEI